MSYDTDPPVDPFAFLTKPQQFEVPTPETQPTPDPPKAPAEPKAPAKSRVSKRCLYVDIETVPDESREHLFDLPPAPSPAEYIPENNCPTPSELLKGTIDDVKVAVAKAVATKNGKQLPAVILAGCVTMERAAQKPRKGVIDLFDGMLSTIENEAATIAAAIDARRKTMSLTPEMCRIVSLGWAVGTDPVESMVVSQPRADGSGIITEENLLRKFWELVARTGLIVGYNVLGFDLPVIFVRSIILDIDPAKKIDMKPWGTDVVDLMLARFPKSPAKPLKSLAAWMGIPIPAEGVDGSQVAELFASDPVKLGDYVRSDIQITRELHRRFRGFFC
jgi:hypothetical protein